MAVFESRVLTWQGKDYSIPANRMFGAIARVEEHVTRSQLIDAILNQSVPYTKLAAAWVAALRYAGAIVTNEQAYEALCEKSDADSILEHPPVRVCVALMSIMLLPKQMETFMATFNTVTAAEDAPELPAKEIADAGKPKPAVSTSQKKPTKSLSANGASNQINSGT